MASKTFDPKALLERQGWKFGSGLGKDEGGIKEAIKVELKMDRAGMGYDASEKYSFQWWDHVFNTAANSIEVVSDENGVSIKKTSTVDVSTKKKSKRQQAKPKTYGCFVKSATLTNNGIEVKDSDSDSSSSDGDSDVGIISKMTDEDLFKACGGMTGHKGARHGLNLTAKLLRIQQHDEEYLRSLKTSSGSTPNRSPATTVLENTKVKTEASNGNGLQAERLLLPKDGQDIKSAVCSSGQENSVRKEKKKRKRDIEENKDETKETRDAVDFKSSSTEMITKGKNKKRKKSDVMDTGEVEINNADTEEVTRPKLPKKKRSSECNENSFVPNGVSTDKETVSLDDAETGLKKLKIRTKHKGSDRGDNDASLVGERKSVDQSEQKTENSEKKSRKLKKKKKEQEKEENEEQQNEENEEQQNEENEEQQNEENEEQENEENEEQQNEENEEQQNEENEEQERTENDPLSNKNRTEATETEGGKQQSKKKEKKSQDKEAITNLMDERVEDASVQQKKCKKSRKRNEASVNEIVDHAQEDNSNESQLQKDNKSQMKEHNEKGKITNQTETLAAPKSKSQRIKSNHADDTEAVLPVPESTDDKKDSRIASKKSKKSKHKRGEDRNLEEYVDTHTSIRLTVCDSESCTSSNMGLENHTLRPKAKRQKMNVGKTN